MLAKLLATNYFRIFALLLIIGTLSLASPSLATNNPVSTADTIQPFLPSPIVLTTQTYFSEKVISKSNTIPYTTELVKDPTLELGEETIIQEGKEGRLTQTILLTYYKDQLFSERVIDQNLEPQQTKIIKQGTKVVIRHLDTEYGRIAYTQKLRMWSTSYVPTCRGCSGITALGYPAGYGIVAVDPSIIPLGKRVYVPGYGLALAGDKGGSIKGKKIDLGFDSLETGWWSARFTDVYILAEQE
ncbi:MAG TPA: G5 domain-containing protein [Patescibacteria group bacterium]|nr:G5 domain-containing protein [Patescibacteria group bacterium]